MAIDWTIVSNPLVVSTGSALVGWYLRQFTNKKRMAHEKEINNMKLKADVVVKSRMKWIEEVRHLSSNLIKTYTDMYSTNKNADIALQSAKKLMGDNKSLMDQLKTETDENKKSGLIKKIQSNNEQLEETKNKYKTLANELSTYVGKFSEMKFLFKSYFSEVNINGTINYRNKDLIDVMEKCASLLIKYCTKPSEISKDELQLSLDNFMDAVSNYLKEEWEKVKRIE